MTGPSSDSQPGPSQGTVSTLFSSLRSSLKKYGRTGVVVYLGLSAAVTASFYVAIENHFEPRKFLHINGETALQQPRFPAVPLTSPRLAERRRPEPHAVADGAPDQQQGLVIGAGLPLQQGHGAHQAPSCSSHHAIRPQARAFCTHEVPIPQHMPATDCLATADLFKVSGAVQFPLPSPDRSKDLPTCTNSKSHFTTTECVAVKLFSGREHPAILHTQRVSGWWWL